MGGTAVKILEREMVLGPKSAGAEAAEERRKPGTVAQAVGRMVAAVEIGWPLRVASLGFSGGLGPGVGFGYECI